MSLKDPSGKEIIPTLVSTKLSGSINIVDNTTPQPRPLLDIPSKFVEGMETYNQGNYQGGSTTFVETYSVPSMMNMDVQERSGGSTTFVETYSVPGAAGKWTLSILPKNTENFEYSITIGAAGK